MAKVLVHDDFIDIRVSLFERLLLAERSQRVPISRVRGVDAHPPLVKLVMHWADQSSVWMSGARSYEGHLVPSTRDPGRTMAIDLDSDDGPLFVEVDDEPCDAVASRITAAIRRSSAPPAGFDDDLDNSEDSRDTLTGELLALRDDASGVSLRPQRLPQLDVHAAEAQPAMASGMAARSGVLVESYPPARKASARDSFVQQLSQALAREQEADSELASVEAFFADQDDDDDVRRRDPLLQGSFPPPPRDAEILHSSPIDLEGLARAGFWLVGGGTVAVLTGTATVGAGVVAGLLLLGAGFTACVVGGLAIRHGASREG